jgi:hypothetical protein
VRTTRYLDALEPTPEELAATEAEMPLIEAELELVDAEIRVLTAQRHPSELDWHRLRRAEKRVAREVIALTYVPPVWLAA